MLRLKTFPLLSLILLWCLSTPAPAEIYKWIDDQGQMHFSDRPSKQHTSATVKVRINSYTHSTITGLDNNSAEINTESSDSRKIIMYSTSWCGYCKKARNFFSSNGIPFVDYDIETSDKGKRDYKKLNGSGVPIILVGKQRMNGFSEAGFKQLYQM
jgi:glutaredoxin